MANVFESFPFLIFLFHRHKFFLFLTSTSTSREIPFNEISALWWLRRSYFNGKIIKIYLKIHRMRLLFFVWSTKGERFVHFFIVSFVIIENRLLKNVELQFLMRIFVLKKSSLKMCSGFLIFCNSMCTLNETTIP